MTSYKVEGISHLNILGEGPHWDHDNQVLYFVDIKSSTVHKYDPAEKLQTTTKIEGGLVSLVIPIEGERNKFVISIDRNLAIMTWDGKSETPASIEKVITVDTEEGKLKNRINDGKADPTGRLWAGTMGQETSPGVVPHGKGSLFSVSKDKVATVHATGISISNGLAWAEDLKTMFYIDSLDFKVDAFDFDADNGQVSNRRTIFNFKENDIEGFPDGMAIDTEGNLWVACYAGAQVIQVNPKTGKLLSKVEIPAFEVTSVAFGGPRLDELYVTTANVFSSNENLKKYPSSGATFRVTGLETKGFPGTAVKF